MPDTDAIIDWTLNQLTIKLFWAVILLLIFIAGIQAGIYKGRELGPVERVEVVGD